MSKTSLRSRSSLRSSSKRGSKRKEVVEEDLAGLKPYGFCCSLDNYDPMTKYAQRNPPIESLMETGSVQQLLECPTLKLRTEFIGSHLITPKKKGSKIRGSTVSEGFDGNPLSRGPLLWYREDEIAVAKDAVWLEKQKIFIEEGKKSAAAGERKVRKILLKIQEQDYPRWYQDFSNWQMQNIIALEELMYADYEEGVTGRTQRALMAIGIASTFVKITPATICRLRKRAKLKPVDFLRELYKFVTGKDFEEEGYKMEYDCNERLILSSIAFLALPETVIELHKRMPPIVPPVFPKKPQFLKPPPPQPCKWPYEESLPIRPDWVTHEKNLNEWRKQCTLVPIPKLILPPIRKSPLFTAIEKDQGEQKYTPIDTKMICDRQNDVDSPSAEKLDQEEMGGLEMKEGKELLTEFDSSLKPDGRTEKFDFTISGVGNTLEPAEYKICGTLKPSFSKNKSWLGEKDARYVISGLSDYEDPPNRPVTFVMTGVAKVSPTNSDEKFFTELKLGDGPKKVYPSGRKNLSKNWQEWLQNADEEFMKVEKEANKLIKSVKAVMRLVVPEPTCDSCCSCRQTRKSHMKWRETKTPYMVVDSITEGDDQKKYIIGSMAMHSPAPSPPESTINLLEVVASRENIEKKLIINGITNDSGETTYYISGVTKTTERIPRETTTKHSLPKPLRNVPPCACTIMQMFNEGLTVQSNTDDIPWTKKGDQCFGQKYRPQEAAAFDCKDAPSDKSCRRNPFESAVTKLKRDLEQELTRKDEETGPLEKKMYSLPDFQPCGGKDNMAVCGGPWGAVNVPDPEEVARREAEARAILKGPPCGDKPGRAICGGPWGARVPIPKRPKSGEEEEEEEDEAEEEEEEESEREKKKQREIQGQEIVNLPKKKKVPVDELCHMSPDKINERTELLIEDEEKENKSNYCDYSNVWDVLRTAPTVERKGIEYEKSLKLTPRKTQSPDPITRSKRLKGKSDPSKNNRKKSTNEIESPKSKEDEGKSDVKGSRKSKKNTDGTKIPKNLSSIKSTGKQFEEIKDTGKGGNRKGSARSKRDDSEKRKNKGEPSYQFGKRSGKSNQERKTPKNKDTFVGNNENEKLKKRSKSGNAREENSREQRSRVAKEKDKVKNLKEKSKKARTSSLPKSPYKPFTSKEDQTYDTKPAILPEEPPKLCAREYQSAEEVCKICNASCTCLVKQNENDVERKEGPFGWRTKSQQDLPAEKNLVYLVEPNYPMETVPVRPGGKPCRCRENRANKKILLYNIGGVVNQGKGRKGQNTSQVLEGVTFITPPPSPRNSDEYVPEYELYKSPYEMCLRPRKDTEDFEQFLGPKSLLPKKSRNLTSCSCGYNETYGIDDADEYFRSNKMREEGANDLETPTKRWSDAFKDEGLIDYFARCRDNVPCWLRCTKFSKDGCCVAPRRLQVVKPVCECKYERKILRREEERKNWTDRQLRLKKMKKQPQMQLATVSRPMKADTKLMISDVKRIPKEDEYGDDVRYCVTGVAENYSMDPARYVLSGVTMHTPLVTPEPSKPDVSCMCGHKHWSSTNIAQSQIEPPKDDYPCRGTLPKKCQFTIPTDGIVCDKSKPRSGYQSCTSPGPCKLLTSNAIASEDESTNQKSEEDEARKPVMGNFIEDNELNDRKNVLDGAKSFTETTGVTRAMSKLVDTTKSLIPGQGQPEEVAEEHESSTNVVAHNKENDKAESEYNLAEIMKNELAKMAEEGFTLAKLPDCFMMPQLKTWVLFRKGVLHSQQEKQHLMEHTKKRWMMMKFNRQPPLPSLTLDMTKEELGNIKFDRAEEMQDKIKSKKELFFSTLRKSRVQEARVFWSTMEFGRHPSLSFKEAFFTYLPGKEADGHVFRPWQISETSRKQI